MKILIPVKMLSIFFLLAGTALLPAQVMENFEGLPVFSVEGTCNEVVIQSVKDPAKADNSVLQLRWPANRASHIAGQYQKPGVVLAEAPGNYEITAKINAEKVGEECANLALRIVDAQNETFQLRVPLEKNGEPGWTKVTWELDTVNPNTHGVASWGGLSNGKIDLPVRLLGFAINFKDSNTSGGALLLDDICVTKSSPVK